MQVAACLQAALPPGAGIVCAALHRSHALGAAALHLLQQGPVGLQDVVLPHPPRLPRPVPRPLLAASCALPPPLHAR